MSTLGKFMLSIICLAASTTVTVWIMMMGWGLSPQSWGVIIGGAFIHLFIMMALQSMTSDSK